MSTDYWTVASCLVVRRVVEDPSNLGIVPQYLVEDVVVALRICQLHHPRALQQICSDCCATDAALLVELDLNELAETRGIVVPGGLGITKRFQQGV